VAGTVKTAISIDKNLFEQVEVLAQEMNVSRSHLFVLAVEQFIRRQQARNLLDRINAAYDDEPDVPEQEQLTLMRGSQRKLVEGVIHQGLLTEPWGI
jgi:hypothetical protein